MVAALVHQLHVTELSLKELTGGTVDAVVGPEGQSYLLQDAQMRLRDSEERFRSIFAAAGTGIAISTPQGRFLQANAAYCRMLGYSEAELRTRDFASITHPDDLAFNLNLRDEVLAGKRRDFVLEKRYLKKNGVVVWTRQSVSATRNDRGAVSTMIVVAEDITEQHRERDSLLLFRKLIDQSHDSIAVVDPDTRRYLDVNDTACSSLGYSRQELLLLSVADIDPFAVSFLRERIEQELRLKGHIIFDSINKRKDGTLFPVEVNMRLVEVEKRYIVAVVRDITERKRIETRFRRLVDSNAQGVFFWNTKGAITDSNDSFLRMVGFTREDLEAGLINWAAMTPPEYSDRDQRALREIAVTGVCTTYEKEWIRKDGSRISILIGAASFEDNPDEGVCFALDLSERIRAEEAMRGSEKRFKALFEQAAVGVAQIDAATGRYLQVNQRFAEILGRSVEELLQSTSSEVTHPQTNGRDLELVKHIKSGELREFTAERRYVKKDDTEVWANVTVSEMWAPGEDPDYYMAILQDITKRKKLEEQFQQAQKMEAMGTLAGGIAHDFNNILASINGYTELAQARLQGNEQVRDYLGSVLKAGHRAADLVRQILSFSRQEKMERAPIQLRHILAESTNLLRATIPTTTEFSVSLAKNAPTVLADATQIHQVIMNLGTNAWHAIRDGAGRIDFRLERCVVDAAHAASEQRLRPGLYARVSISDNGCGMSKETMRRIFEPFFTTKEKGVGTGLGLSVVHGIMESHDGAITVYSHLGEGTVFHLYFPAHEGTVVMPTEEEGIVPLGHGEQILVIDDEELLARLGKETLIKLGYLADTLTEPEAALALVRANPSRYALVLTDQTMPGMTGLALAEAIRQARPGLPVILMTGFSGSISAERIEAAGICRLLLKPASMFELGTAVHDVLAARNPS
jgi:PAS domain S-box-containing protein